jgi:hypothetical protein
MDDGHIRFFTLKTIKAMVKEAGLIIGEMRRVRIPAFETELSVDRSTFPTELVALALADPEAETYQFVFTAIADPGEHQLGRIAEQNLVLEQELDRLRVANGALRAARDLAQADAQRLAEQEQSQQLTVSALRAELDAASRTIRRVDGSVCWQAFKEVRRRVYGVLGGERSPFARAIQAMLRFVGRGLLCNDDERTT